MEVKTCFLVCPIGKEGSATRKRSDDLMKYLIEPVCKDMNYNLVRADKIATSNKIDEEIFDYLENAELVICDISEHNPNAFLELGYRLALKKNCIQIAEIGTQLPFDISNIRTFFYTTEGSVSTIENFKNSLKDAIKNSEMKSRYKSLKTIDKIYSISEEDFEKMQLNKEFEENCMYTIDPPNVANCNI